ncbi:MAG: ribonuclease P protein component [Cyanothece sp. SIO2G6]|nr:ribonuclease P protein component [Cyanothece sp. SIO2G6]
MLPKMHRLRHRKNFNRVYREGLRQNSRHLTLRALNLSRSQKGKRIGSRHSGDRLQVAAQKENAQKKERSAKRVSDRGEASKLIHHSQLSEADSFPNAGAPPTQIGISISTKVSKRAVVRNRIKRQIKAAMFSLLPGIASNWLIVISVRPEAIECDYRQFLRELEEMIKNLR